MGPLSGLTVIEMKGLGPAPFCGMLLADMGASVISVARQSADITQETVRICERGKRSIALNLKTTEGRAAVLALCERADVLIEGFRPGVMERLGLGPDACLQSNPKLIFARMTGWGQTGPLAQVAGHDINYIALTGALHATGRAGEKPLPPLNLVGDFGGGGMMMAFGIMSAVFETQKSGKGQVIDVSMVEGASLLMAMMYSFKANGSWSNERGTNMLDSGAHFYDSYETLDQQYVSIGSIEPQFYALLIELTGIDPQLFSAQMDKSAWPQLSDELSKVFKTKSRDQWCDIMEGTDVCFAPVLNMDEAPEHPQNVARESFFTMGDVVQPSPAPKFSRSVPDTPSSWPAQGADTEAVLDEMGYTPERISELREMGVLT